MQWKIRIALSSSRSDLFHSVPLLFALIRIPPLETYSFSHIFKRIFEVSPRTNPHTFNSFILILWNIFLSLLCTGMCILATTLLFFSFVRWRLRMKVQKTFNAFSRCSRNICLRNSNFSLAQRPDTFFVRVSSYYQDRSRWKQTNVIINCFWQSEIRKEKNFDFIRKLRCLKLDFEIRWKVSRANFERKFFFKYILKKKEKDFD